MCPRLYYYRLAMMLRQEAVEVLVGSGPPGVIFGTRRRTLQSRPVLGSGRDLQPGSVCRGPGVKRQY